MALVIGLGVIASAISWAIILPPARELRIKLGTLLDMAERGNPQRFRDQLAPISPFAGGRFEHRRVTGILRTDFTPYGEICQRLHRESRALDRRAHIGMMPFGVYLLGVGAWWLLR